MARIIDWWFDRELGSTVVLGSTILLLLLAMGTVFVHEVEGWGWIDSAYFAVTAITTLGAANLVPQREITKLFLIVWLPIGIGVGFTVLASIGARILGSQRKRLERIRQTVSGHGNQDEGGR